MSHYELEYQRPDQSSVKVPVTDQPVTFGRTPAAQVVISWDPSISGRHFQVVTQGEQLYLTDLRSTNGTFVNGQRVPGCEIQIGDQIRAGNTSFKVLGIRRGLATSTPSVSTDSVHLSESDFNILKSDSAVFPAPPPPVDGQADTAIGAAAVGSQADGANHALAKPAEGTGVAQFFWSHPEGQRHAIRLPHVEILEIGRAPECDICLADDPYVSWQHSQVRWHEGAFWLSDLKSVSGTWVNDARWVDGPLPQNGTMRVGRASIEFQLSLTISTEAALGVVDVHVAEEKPDTSRPTPVVVETCPSGLLRVRSIEPPAESDRTTTSSRRDPSNQRSNLVHLVSSLVQPFPGNQVLWVVDFGRIGERPPADLELSTASPFAELGDAVAVRMPVVMTSQEFVQWPMVWDLLHGRDACLICLTEQPKSDVVAKFIEWQQVRTTPSVRIPPATMGLFWPSVLDSLLFNNIQQFADRWTAVFPLVLMENPQQPLRWQAFGSDAAIARLVDARWLHVVTADSQEPRD